MKKLTKYPVVTILIGMKKIYTYNDYRFYLRDYYEHMKKSTSFFSYRYFSSKADIKSPVFLKQVIEGKRNLTANTTEKFIKALNLSDKEETFFRYLVRFNQAKTSEEKQEHYAVLISMNEYVVENKLRVEQYTYFDRWYYAAIRELVTLFDFKDNHELLAQMLRPSITTKQARDAVSLLLSLSLIYKDTEGRYRQSDSAITGGTDILNAVRRKHNSDMVERALYANREISPSERNVSGVTMGVSSGCYDMIVAEIQNFKERVKTIVSGDLNSSRVYQLNVQLFPLSEQVPTDEGLKHE